MRQNWHDICEQLDSLIVGGAVRDLVMNEEPSDVDYIVLNKSPAEMLALGFQGVGKTISAPVFLHKLDPHREEYALPRLETSTGDNTSDFKYTTAGVRLEDDLHRRDFTINAMAMTHKKQIIDPFNGRDDIECEVIRHVGPAFIEDPLRIFRAARFAAKMNFTIAPETSKLCRSMVKQGLHKIVEPDRVREETRKAFSRTCFPSIYFDVLQEFGALEYWFAPLYKMRGISQPEAHHAEGDVYKHTLLVLDETRVRTSDVPTLFAALLHDVGKIDTPEGDRPSHHKHEKLGEHHIIQVANRIKATRKAKHMAILMAKWHMHFHKVFDLRPGKLLKVFNALDARHLDQNVLAWCIIGESDEMGRDPQPLIEYVKSKTKYVLEAMKAFREIKANPGTVDVKQDLTQRQVEAIKKVKKKYACNAQA